MSVDLDMCLPCGIRGIQLIFISGQMFLNISGVVDTTANKEAE
jgi:hypothetical protein